MLRYGSLGSITSQVRNISGWAVQLGGELTDSVMESLHQNEDMAGIVTRCLVLAGLPIAMIPWLAGERGRSSIVDPSLNVLRCKSDSQYWQCRR